MKNSIDKLNMLKIFLGKLLYILLILLVVVTILMCIKMNIVGDI
ncbi:putative membrane protein [Acinetobacter baumannii 58452]|nr:putative membrane protein [Acinetobacter baumannii 58452]